ncbi:P-loop containing nucleoside triphosphate hydrolase protein [Armillaria gallica]|uniref:DNA 3'-5' helicase n=1 Tax=Armillaria gallica TaxID=47427 RepID=A0A2H3C8L2_ARMGA|nr:P-loop containing nucleoside triphosphate hydrolase protein [Armillaria gallica]
MPEKDEEVQARVQAIFRCSPCLWQIDVARRFLAGEDVITIAPTGAGKSLTYWIPLVFAEKGIVIVVLPLKQLRTQFSSSLISKGFSAISVTTKNTCNTLYSDMKNGKYHVIMFSPEIIEQDSCFDSLIKSKKFMDQLINVVFDKAHCIKEWGNTFYNSYQKLSHLRHLMARRVPYHLGTAALPPSAIEPLKKELHLDPNMTILWSNTDQPNIFFHVQQMEYPINSYHDLAFLIPKVLDPDGPLPVKFLVFFNSCKEAEEGVKFLCSWLPSKLRDKVKWVHSGMTDEFWEDSIHALKIGEDIGKCATDAVGLGIDIPDVYIIVQFHVTINMSTWMQCAGHAIHDLLLNGTAILLVESFMFNGGKAMLKDTLSIDSIPSTHVQIQPAEHSGKENMAPALGPLSLNQSHKQNASDMLMSTCLPPKSAWINKRPTIGENNITNIHSIPIKVERAMDDFINAENCPEKCQRKVACIYFGNMGLAPAHCCNMCESEYWPICVMDAYKKPRIPLHYNSKDYERGLVEDQLRDTWVMLQHNFFKEKIPGHLLLLPHALWPTPLLEHIINLVHYGQLATVEDVNKQLEWAYAKECGP